MKTVPVPRALGLGSVFALALILSLQIVGTGQALATASSTGSTPLASGCLLSNATAAEVAQVHSSLVGTPGQTYGIAVTPNSQDVFVSTDNPATLQEYSLKTGIPTREGPNWWTESSVGSALAGDEPSGLAFTSNRRHLVVATGIGAAVFEVDSSGASQSALRLVGTLASPGGQPLEIALSPDGRFVLLSDHESGELAVFDLQRALTVGFGPKDLIGTVALGVLPGGMSFSPNGRYLYIVSEKQPTGQQVGSLTTLSVAALEKQPSRAVVSTVDSGCGSVRVTATSSRVYVTARDADSLLSFSAKALVDDPSHALVGDLDVGAGPIGIAVANHDRGLAVADSLGGDGGDIVVLRIGRHGEPSLAGYVNSGQYPREMATSPNGKWLFVGDWQSDQLQSVQVKALLATWPNF